MRRILAIVLCLTGSLLAGQTISSGTVQGTITDPSSALVAGAEVQLTNSATGFQRMVTTDNSGTYRFGNVPMNEYQLTVTAMGFAPDTEHVDVRSTLPITLNVALKVATETTSVTVEASGAQVETDTSTHQDVDRSMFLKLPTSNPGGALNQAITYSTGAVAADANGLFHPVGDHADTSYVIDGQPITDQQSKTFSTQIPLNALQNMQLITGAVNAEYGDKTSLVVDATTRSGLGSTKAFGNIESSWGSFGTWSQDATFGFGSPTFGNFIALNGIRSSRFLDSPESLPFHDIGNNESLFDRVDWQPT
ncbi:MAG TPA: carboxypeptidase regulatory-like domain-containing protein, partial [Bryobacteraceae bacterium]